MSCECPISGLLPVESAQQLIINSITPITQTIECELGQALSRIVASDVISPINVPAYANSAMDGYALCYADLATTQTLTQIGKSFAGAGFTGRLQPGECVRIMTGAPIPEGADTVVMQENTQAQGLQITFTKPVKQGDAIRPQGDDITQGCVVVAAGSVISPVDIGLLASLGFASVMVLRPLTVAVFSTGDELLAPGSSARDDRIFDTNRPMLIAMLQRCGVEVVDLGIIQDDKSLIRDAFIKANAVADCVITSGGVSVGEADYTKEILDEYGTIDFWKLAIKPGKPLAFGRLPDSVFFGLPGNPVSAAVTFDQIVVPALTHLSGGHCVNAPLLPAICSTTFKKRPGRTDFQRAEYFIAETGELSVRSSGSQSSGVLSGFRRSNCYAILENERGSVAIGDTVYVRPFSPIIA